MRFNRKQEKKYQLFNLEYLTLLLALQILLFPAVILTMTGLFWWFTLPITALHFPISLVVTIALSFLLIKNKIFQKSKTTDFSNANSRQFLKVTAIFILLILVSFFISTVMYDFSLDGQVYHQPGIIILESGWVPFHQHFIGGYDFFFREAAGDSAAIVDHFSKASWILAASVYAFTGLLEAGKMFHFLFLAAAFLISFLFLCCLKRIPGKSKFIIAVLAALNPVCLYQLSTFYNDGLLASLLTILMAAALQYLVFADRKAIFFMAITIPVLINIKFTGLVYGVIVVMCTWLAVLVVKKNIQTRFILYLGAAFITAVVFVGYQPYITNIIHKGNPFYPAINIEKGQDAALRNIERGQAPEAFIEKNRFSKLIYSLFSSSDNDIKQMPRLKIPFTVNGPELVVFIGPDTRYGGFGPFFGPGLLLVITFVPLFFKLKRVILVYTLIAVAVVLISTLINPEAWWARLSPQLWLLPMIFISASYYSKKNKSIKYWRCFVICLLVINCSIILFKNTGHHLKVTRLFKNQMSWMANTAQHMNISWKIYPQRSYLTIQYRLNNFKVPHQMEKTLKAKRTRLIIGSWGAKFYLEDKIFKLLKQKRSKQRRKKDYSPVFPAKIYKTGPWGLSN